MKISPIAVINQNDMNKLFNNSDSHWFHHTEHWRAYTLNMRDSGSKDFSFGVYQDNDLVAFSPLTKQFIFNMMAGLRSEIVRCVENSIMNSVYVPRPASDDECQLEIHLQNNSV